MSLEERARMHRLYDPTGLRLSRERDFEVADLRQRWDGLFAWAVALTSVALFVASLVWSRWAPIVPFVFALTVLSLKKHVEPWYRARGLKKINAEYPPTWLDS